MILDIEIWRPVVGYEGRYSVSSWGRVKSHRGRKDIILRAGVMSGGHLSVALGRGNTRTVHSLVLEAFVCPRPEGCECLHMDGNHHNNELENLMWGTRSQNIRDKKWHGNPRKLSVEAVRDIKAQLRKYKRGDVTRLAKQYGVDISTISAIRNGRFHNDIE